MKAKPKKTKDIPKDQTLYEIQGRLIEINDEALFYDGLEEALIGYVEQYGRPAIALYDREKCITVRMKEGMTREEAEEFFEYNTIGGYVGESTPAFATILKKEKK